MPALIDQTPSRVLADALRSIRSSKEMNGGIKAMKSRASLFHSTLEMELTGAAMVPEARAMLRDRVAGYWERNSPKIRDSLRYSVIPEIVVGGGLHAAIYCAVRVLTGHPAPVVLEKYRPGGVFAVSRSSSWFLNQRNWPGSPGQPDEPYSGSLAHLPGAPVQLSHITGSEYPTNADLSFVIEMTLAQYAQVIQGEYVQEADLDYTGTLATIITDSGSFQARRVLDARGIGVPIKPPISSAHDMDFMEFMARMDLPFPFQGMSRMAVMGDGDGAVCVLESLLGIGPSTGMSMPELDFLEHMDIYAPRKPSNRYDWKRDVRNRYSRVGSYLYRERSDNDLERVRLYNQRGKMLPTLNGVVVNGRNYDHSVHAIGWRSHDNIFSGYEGSPRLFPDEDTAVARRYGTGDRFFTIGPRAGLPWTGGEVSRGVAELAEQLVSIWRLAPKTAALAATLS